jgi:hypothetical protein
LHEFEALLLSDPGKFACYYDGHQRQIQAIVDLCSEFGTPERIDDGEETAPSKRIGRQIPEYLGAKPTAGPIIAEHIGLKVMREKCPHFNQWLNRLEVLGASSVEH